MITDPSSLERLLATLSGVERIALDTEADSLHSYQEKLCLVQVATEDFCDLLDPLSGIDIQVFLDSLRGKEVVIHGADYDLRLLFRSGEFAPGEVFDTMLAARLVGEPQVGLAALLKKYFGIEISKASQRANWGLRPLPQQLCEYARNDVRHLLSLANLLRGRLEALGRMEWLREWVGRVVESARNPREKSAEEVWRIPGTNRLTPRAQAVVRSLWHWRDAEAREWNRPAFHVMSNSDILRIAENAVLGQPFSTPRFPAARRRRFENVLEHALQIPQEQWPVVEKRPRPQLPADFGRRLEEIRRKRDEVAAELGLEPAVVAPRSVLEALAAERPARGLMRWQAQLLGVPWNGVSEE